MRLIVCVDDGGGMSFCGKRQSKDRLLRKRILEITEGRLLWMNGYSAGQFEEESDSIRVAEDFLALAGEVDWCFAETQELSCCADRVRVLVIYRWNRRYPSDRKLPESLTLSPERAVSRRDFAGSSHERITEEVYVL